MSFLFEASYNTEKSEGVEGESAQRCKARLERYRRTAERAVYLILIFDMGIFRLPFTK